MSIAPAEATDVRANRSDRVRHLVVAVSAVFAVIASFIGSGATGGTPIQDAAGGALAADATLIAPAGPAFAIWTPIYLGLLAYAVCQFLPSLAHQQRQRRVGYWAAASLILNGGWILSVQFDQLVLSAVLIVLLLAVLCRIFILLVDSRPESPLEATVLDVTMGLYLGWVTIATVANLTALLVVAGFDGFGWPAEAWAVSLLVVAGLIGLGLAVRGRGRLSPALALSWGLLWVAVGRLGDGPESAITGIAAIAAAAVVMFGTVLIRMVSPRR